MADNESILDSDSKHVMLSGNGVTAMLGKCDLAVLAFLCQPVCSERDLPSVSQLAQALAVNSFLSGSTTTTVTVVDGHLSFSPLLCIRREFGVKSEPLYCHRISTNENQYAVFNQTSVMLCDLSTGQGICLHRDEIFPLGHLNENIYLQQC